MLYSPRQLMKWVFDGEPGRYQPALLPPIASQSLNVESVNGAALKP